MKLDIQLFGGRGQNSKGKRASKSNKTITYKTTNGKEEQIKLNGKYIRNLKDLGLEQIRGKEFNSRVEMFDYLSKQIPDSASIDRRTAEIKYLDNQKEIKDNKLSRYNSYQIITYKNKENKKIGISFVGGGSYKDTDDVYKWIRYY